MINVLFIHNLHVFRFQLQQCWMHLNLHQYVKTLFEQAMSRWQNQPKITFWWQIKPKGCLYLAFFFLFVCLRGNWFRKPQFVIDLNFYVLECKKNAYVIFDWLLDNNKIIKSFNKIENENENQMTIT